MKLVVFGLSISSSWGNGHATVLRGLFRALAAQSHQVTFFEKDVPYYASHRDLTHLLGLKLDLYSDWRTARPKAEAALEDADVAMVTSYCPDGIAATELVLQSRGATVFYDLDTPVTLARLARGEQLTYIGQRGLADFDLVLSFTGGPALQALRSQLGAGRTLPLYGSADPEVHRPVRRVAGYQSDLSYLGTYSEDRQETLDQLLLEPARRAPQQKFIIGGATYPEVFPWTSNIYFVRHLPPTEHAAFYSSSRVTLNVTRRPMKQMGFCPSGRLFEAAACGVPILSDEWPGLDQFFLPETEIVIVRSAEDVLSALQLPQQALDRIAAAARVRVLREHTAEVRAREFETALQSVWSDRPGKNSVRADAVRA
ncbi:MAG TPA: glycosyltransferase [Candidatus Acidoferrales bacterium]|nr:glycosyltransferase [Candidatus Acidoferrales bacterium]